MTVVIAVSVVLGAIWLAFTMYFAARMFRAVEKQFNKVEETPRFEGITFKSSKRE